MTSGWACAACGDENPPGMAFCGRCGARDEADRPLPEDLWGCRGCGTPNAAHRAFCGRCGSRRGVERADDLRLVTALFADISGFTTLADRLDAEDLHAVINPLVAGLAGVAERYGGFVAKYAGDALLCLFGAPVAHEDDAQRALLAAHEMQAGLPALLAALGPAAKGLTIHIGVNTGKVVAGAVGSAAQNDYSVLGDSVILAQRLESVCPSGHTYVGESTRELTKDEFDFEDVGELQLKGKLSLVRAFRLVGRKRAGTDASRPLVGRERELAAVLRGVESTGAVLVCGEPGVGKSRLLAETRLRVTADGAWWLQLRCLSYGAALAYWPFVDLVRQALGLRVEDDPELVLERLRTTLPDRLVAGASRLLGRPLDDLEPEAARRQVHDALSGMLAFLSGDRPITLAVEDAHWIDSSSADVLGELLRAPDGISLSVVLTTRPEGVPACEHLLSAGQRTTVELGPLGPESVPLLASALLGRPLVGTALALVVARTHGNPLFAEELMRSLHEEGALVTTSAGLDLRPGYDVDAVPQTVERVLSARVDALPLPALAVLSIAAVVGRVARLSLLARVATANGTDLAHLEHLVATGLLERVVEQDEAAVTFHHALLQDVVYGRLLKRQKVALHRTVAEAGLALYGDGDETVDLLARHLFLADAGEQALTALLRAARRAARLFANDAAAEHLTRALELLPDDDVRRSEVASELAHLQVLRGHYDAALQAFSALRGARRVASDWSGEASVLRRQGRYAEAVTLLEAGLGQFDAVAGLPLVVELIRSQLAAGHPAEALQAVRGGLAVADETDRARLLVELLAVEEDVGHPEFAVAHGKRALAVLRRDGRERELASALRRIGGAQSRLGQLDEAATTLREAIALSERIGHVEEAAGALVNLALVEAERGLSDAAAAGLHRAAGIFERLGHASGRAISYGNLADLVLSQGCADEALTWALRSLALAREIDLNRQVGVALLTVGEIEVARGRSAEAVAACREARQVFEELSASDMVDYCDRVLLAASDVEAASLPVSG